MGEGKNKSGRPQLLNDEHVAVLRAITAEQPRSSLDEVTGSCCLAPASRSAPRRTSAGCAATSGGCGAWACAADSAPTTHSKPTEKERDRERSREVIDGSIRRKKEKDDSGSQAASAHRTAGCSCCTTTLFSRPSCP